MIRLGPPSEGECSDVCVVGAGPAGIAVALSCARRGHTVVLLEAGGAVAATQRDTSMEVLDESVHAPLDVTTRRGIGGTSAAWGGICVPFDMQDYEPRPWIPHSGWPVRSDEISPWDRAAVTFLDCGIPSDNGLQDWASDAVSVRQVGQLARVADIGTRYRDELERMRGVIVSLRAPVTRIVCDPTGARVAGVVVATGAGTRVVRARHYVMACGGLRTTQLLLSLAREWPLKFAAGRAPLGRYYMGHLTGEIAVLTFRDPKSAIPFLFCKDRLGLRGQRRLSITHQRQAAERLLGNAFMLRSVPPAEAASDDGALSAVALIGSMPGATRLVRSERFRIPRTQARHLYLRSILRRPAKTALDLVQMMRQLRQHNLPVLLYNQTGRYRLRYHAEQAPNPASTVTLDQANAARTVVDFKHSEMDFTSVVRSHEILDESVRALGVGAVEYLVPHEERLAAVKAQASDGYHQIGTTRMSDNAEEGVVDRDCKVHGFDNLYVASASTFPTSGSANPTLPIVSLALRLADHISRMLETVVL